MQRINYSKKDVEQWFYMLQNGATKKEISTKYNVSQGVILRNLRKFEFIDNKFKYDIKLNEEARILYNKARNYYISGHSLTETMRVFDIPISKTTGFKNYLIRTGVKIKSNSELFSFVTNHDFFKNIDSEIKAYLLGFFAADGHIEKRKDYNSYTLRIMVKLDDCHILMLYNNLLTNGKRAINVSKTRDVASVAFTSKQIGEDLLSLGFDSNKTENWKELPKIPEDMYRHFIRGLFDGDGSIMLNSRKSGNRLSGFNRRMAIVNRHKNILEQISKKINVDFHFKDNETGIKYIKGKKTTFKYSCTAEVWKLEDLQHIFHYLYDDATYYFLRKKHKFELAIMNDKDCYASLQGNLY